MKPQYDLDKIKFSIDGPTFEKAVGLYEGGKIKEFKEDIRSYSAVVIGSSPYHVFVSSQYHDRGDCDCYLGQDNTLCKHMIVVAIRAVTGGRPLNEEDRKLVSGPVCSGKLGALDKEELSATKKTITSDMRYIKSYNGPSKTWFAYQNSLSEGCNRLSKLISDLPVSIQTTKLIVAMLLKIDEKLCRGGIDDSDGTVGGFIEEVVRVLEKYARLDSSCAIEFKKLDGRETCFGWEEPLLKLIRT